MREPASDETDIEHPDLEELAALLDGRLDAQASARVRKHLGECPDCYEIFTETAQLQQEMGPAGAGEVVPGPFWRSPSRGIWLAAAAAVLAVAVGIAVFKEHTESPAAVRVADLTQPLLGKKPHLEGLVWHEAVRGSGGEEDSGKLREPSFQVGVELYNLQAGLEANDEPVASGAVAKINGLLEDFTVDKKVADFYIDLHVQLEKTPPRTFAKSAAKVADTAFETSSLDPLYVNFGKWAEAGRLGAIAHASSLFDQPSMRDFPGELRAREGKDLDAEVSGALTEIENRLGKRNLQPADYGTLKGAFERILQRYYPQGRPFTEAP